MEIRPLADATAAILVLAEWFYTEWHSYEGRSRAAIEGLLGDSLNRDALPITSSPSHEKSHPFTWGPPFDSPVRTVRLGSSWYERLLRASIALMRKP